MLLDQVCEDCRRSYRAEYGMVLCATCRRTPRNRPERLTRNEWEERTYNSPERRALRRVLDRYKHEHGNYRRCSQGFSSAKVLTLLGVPFAATMGFVIEFSESRYGGGVTGALWIALLCGAIALSAGTAAIAWRRILLSLARERLQGAKGDLDDVGYAPSCKAKSYPFNRDIELIERPDTPPADVLVFPLWRINFESYDQMFGII